MCLSHEQKLLAGRTASAWPPERLVEVAARSSVPVQYLSSIFDLWRKRTAKERAVRQIAPPIKPHAEGLTVAEYSLRHSLSPWIVYQQVKSGTLSAVKAGGAMRVQARQDF
jgi:hypothetical protein